MGCPPDNGYFTARLPAGERNAITDVPGVLVGHCTLAEGDLQTGVTAILPHSGDLFREKLPAGHAMFNGFGKTVGLMQLAEMGTLETPIVLTNTLSVGTAYTALVRRAMAEDPDIGVTAGTVNPLVCECNDGALNDIRALAVREEHVFRALAAAGPAVAEGAVGAGRGMVCYGYKGGIGTASRLVSLGGLTFRVGCLVLTNHGRRGDLRFPDRPAGGPPERTPDRGSVITVLATDCPLSSRQLDRLSRRAIAGLCRSGSIIGGGSGELAVSFSTAYRVCPEGEDALFSVSLLREGCLDHLFAAAAEAVEDAVWSSLLHGETVSGVRASRVEAFPGTAPIL